MVVIEDVVAAHRAKATTLASRPFPDGGAVELVAVGGGARLRVERVRGDARSVLWETEFEDEARSVFEAARAGDPDWHPAYLPLGASPPDRDSLTVRVFAVGPTVEACVEAFADSKCGVVRPGSLWEDADQPPGEWFVRFVIEPGGAGMKLSGRRVPGGCVATWWK